VTNKKNESEKGVREESNKERKKSKKRTDLGKVKTLVSMEEELP